MPRLMAYTVRVCPTHGRVWFPERKIRRKGSRAHLQSRLQKDGDSDSDEDKTAWEYCRKVFGSSSVSGVNHIALAKTRRRRIFWAFIFTVSLVGFFYQFGAFLVQYREYQSIVQIDIQNAGSLMFPAVTLCNANRFKKSKFCSKFREFCPRNLSTMDSLTEKELFDFQLAILREGPLRSQAFSGTCNRRSFVSCSFTGKPSIRGEGLQTFKESNDPDLGNCYTLPLLQKVVKKSFIPRKRCMEKMMLKLSFLSGPCSERGDEEYLEPDRDAAVLVTFHSPEVYPDPFSDGTEVKPGNSYNFGLKKNTVEMLPAPYSSNCTNYENLPWDRLHDKTLSTRMCTAECSQSLQLKQCNYVTVELSLFFDALPWKQESFDPEKIECAERVSNETKEFCRSLCRVPCKQSNYENYHGFFDVATESESMLLRNNLAHVRAYFITMEDTTLKHSPKYQPLEMFSHIGGYVGIWLGISLLALCEFIEGAIRVVSFILLQRKKRKELSRDKKAAAKAEEKKRVQINSSTKH
ncbi:Acid-sensing ion channel 1B like protein [Argiope bruennichi]|uniref:Acid-sensing ion channel 1B like protein n=1 Tax=Argiope bruennichi TaxID=94029 RepID=A0A8T0FY87_ARGBR|nr:Acid-sensing ion channel 1B like protein [Argiope bruennichi]